MQTLPTIDAAGQQMRRARLTPADLLDHCLACIGQWEGKIHAWVVVDEADARRQAQRLTEMASRGEFAGPLHGIPIGIKDIIDVAGLPTRAGSPLRNKQSPAQWDAPVVAKLRAAGAIILGKTVTTQWACFDPSPTRNPWNLAHTPGGSSSGSAAAVACGMCLGALGSQTGGSIIRPASYCGVAGLKPTFDRASRKGVVPVSQQLDHVGPLARCTADLLCLWEAIRDDAPVSFSQNERSSDLPPRLALPRQFFFEEALGNEGGGPSVRDVTTSAIAHLAECGATVDEFNLPNSFAQLHEMHYCLMAYDAAQFHRQAFAANRDLFGTNVSGLIEDGLAISLPQYEAAAQHQAQFKSQIAQSFPPQAEALVMPSTDTTAPANLETTGSPRFQAPWSYAGLPAVTIPCGIDSAGLPCGLQLVGRPNTDENLLSVATWCEHQLQFTATPPLPNSS